MKTAGQDSDLYALLRDSMVFLKWLNPVQKGGVAVLQQMHLSVAGICSQYVVSLLKS